MIVFTVLSSWQATSRVHPVHTIWNGTKRTPTISTGRTTLAVSPPALCRLPAGCQKPHPPSPFIIITQPESWYSFYYPTEGRRLSQPRHCSKGVQLVPKSVYRSGFYKKTCNCTQWDSNLGPLTPQSGRSPLDHCNLQRSQRQQETWTTESNRKCQCGRQQKRQK